MDRRLVHKNPQLWLRRLAVWAVNFEIDCPELEGIAGQLHRIDERMAFRRVYATGFPDGRTRRV
jgi:hypothetical protein